MADAASKKARAFFWARELIAILVWSWTLTKLFIFDLDVFLVQTLAPGYVGILRYKLLFLLALISIVWLSLQQTSYYEFVLYVVAYPLVWVWRGLKALYRHWPLLIAFAPPIYLALRRARATFALYTLAFIAAAVIMNAHSASLIFAAIAILEVFLVVHVVRRLREALGSGVFRELARWTKSLEAKVLEYAFAEPSTSTVPPQSNDPNPKQTQRLSQCYMFY